MGSFSRIALVVLIALAALLTRKDQALAQERIGERDGKEYSNDPRRASDH